MILVILLFVSGILRDVLEPLDQIWLAERFSTAAVRRYHRLAGAVDDQHPFGMTNPPYYSHPLRNQAADLFATQPFGPFHNLFCFLSPYVIR